MFFLLTLLLCFSSSDSTSLLCFSTLHIVGSFTSKLPLNTTIPNGQMVKGFFHQQYAAISRSHVYLFHVFLVVLDLRRVSERVCEFFFAMQETFWQQGVFLNFHQVTTGVQMLKSVCHNSMYMIRLRTFSFI